MQCSGPDERVEVRNSGRQSANLAGWTLVSVVGDQRFDFPNFVLEPERSVFVHSGPESADTQDAHLHWTSAYVWNNRGDEAVLLNPEGITTSSRDCASGP